MQMSKLSTMRRKIQWPMIVWMTTVHALAIVGVFYLNIVNLGLIAGLYFVTCCLGICIGYHRLLTHRSFKTHKFMRRFFATCGSLALQGGPSAWVGDHRMHHVASDTEQDPHNAKKGFWYSHIGWIFFEHRPENRGAIAKLCRDIRSDWYMRMLDMGLIQIGMQVILGAGLLYLFGWGGVFCGIFLRLIVSYHFTWFVNSLCHMWGYTTYKTKSLARNNWVVGVLTWGEGWHNNHHANESRVKAGMRWWEVDVSYYVIKVLSWFGLTWGLRV